MNNIIKTALILIGAGALLLLLSFVLVRGQWTGYNSKGNDDVKQTYESGKGIEEINIEGTTDSIIFRAEDTDTVMIDYYDSPENPKYEIVDEGGKLTFKRCRSTFKLININFSQKDIVITLPSNYAGTLDLGLSSGSIVADDITVGQISIENTSGSYEMKNINCQGDVEIENTSGSVAFEVLKTEGDISISNTAGSIEGTIDGKKSDYTITSDVTAGSSNLENTTGGSKNLSAKTTAGSIVIIFTE